MLPFVLVTALLLLGILELRRPYFFMQDDNLEYYFPAYMHNWRSLLSGHFALYNFHTFAGIPHAVAGQLATFYPLPYLTIGLSQLIWGHPFAAMDLLAILHGLIAVAGGYFLLRQTGATDLIAAFGALTALSAYFVWVGEMWSIVPVLCAWFPWMCWAALRFLESPSFGRAAALVAFRLALLYGGHPQFFVMASIFEHLFTLSYTAFMRRETRPPWLRYLALNIPTALLGCPYLLPVTVEMTRSLQRSQPLSYREFSDASMSSRLWFSGQFLVFHYKQAQSIVIESSLPFLSHIGYVPTLLSLGTIVLWWKRPKDRKFVAAATLAFVIALLWAWNVLGPVIYHLPILNRFRWPFKIEYFAGFFQCLLASLVLALLARRWQRLAIAAFVVNWLVAFSLFHNHGWRVRSQEFPITSPWTQDLRDGRYLVVSDNPVTSVSSEHLEFNYSMVWGLDNLLGYDPMLPILNARISFGDQAVSVNATHPIDYHSGAWSEPLDRATLDRIKKLSTNFVLVSPEKNTKAVALHDAGWYPRTAKAGWTLWQDPKALGRVRWESDGGAAGIESAVGVNSIDIQLSQWPERALTLAYAANPDLQVCVGHSCQSVTASPDGLIHIPVIPGTRSIRVVYRSTALLAGFGIALGTALLIGAARLYWNIRGSRPSDVSQPPPGRSETPQRVASLLSVLFLVYSLGVCSLGFWQVSPM